MLAESLVLAGIIFVVGTFVGEIARPLFTDYVVPFELTGILLLVAIVGALVLAKKAS